MSKENIFTWIFGVAAVAVICLEIFLSAEKTTKIESSLFAILQFVFSIAFAWFLSKYSSKSEFESQQKKFAVAAFRRIKEIESQANHLIIRLSKGMNGPEEKYCNELDIAKTLAMAIKSTTLSSKLDWADVIGDQLEVIEKIENIQGEVFQLSDDGAKENSDSLIGKRAEIEELKKALPTELKLAVDQTVQLSSRQILHSEFDSRGELLLRGFSEDNWNCRDTSTLKLGEKLVVKLADEGNRIASLAAYDAEGKFVGSFLNKYPGTYAEFTMAVCEVLGSSEFVGEVLSISPARRPKGRSLFDLIVKPKRLDEIH